jgi:hypothetical protein
MTTWSEGKIARAIALQTLARKCIVLVDRCNWTGHECDVLGVTTDLRLIDVEVKISRADFKVDAKKEKWWHRLSYSEALARGLTTRGHWDPHQHGTRRDWPPKVWKHYVAMPAELWDAALFEFMPSPASGLLLVREQRNSATPIAVHCERRALPNKDAQKLNPAQAVDIARLANLRMWEAYKARGMEVAA